MEHLKEDKARIFDAFYSNNNLNMLKICSFFVDERKRPYIAVMIKYMELNICMQKSMKHSETPFSSHSPEHNMDMEDFINEISEYLPQEGHELLEQMKNIKENMEMYSQMMEMMNLMNENTDNVNQT